MSASFLADSFRRLGERVEAVYRRQNYNDADLPAIAEDALADWNDDVAFDASATAEFLATTSVPQQPHPRFSDLPITVFRQREFYIEVLVWTRSTTALHEHGFSGAFRLLQGSSIHSTFGFEPTRVIGPDFVLGSLTPRGAELLQKGAIRRIHPGSGGLIHSLYHLDNPSLTLVIRTHGHERHQPQLAYYAPCFAVNDFRFDEDELVGMMRCLLSVAKSVDAEGGLRIWVDHVARLDFSRLAYLYLHKLDGFADETGRQTFLTAVRQSHGDLADRLHEAAVVQERQAVISRSRTVLTDPDLRFFLALLMNVPDKAALLALVRQRHPDRDPVEQCAHWLTRLSEGKVDIARRMALMLDQANLGAHDLGRRIGAALPAGVEPAVSEALFASFIRGGGEIDHLRAKHPGLAPADLDRFHQRLVGLDELACLRGLSRS